MKLRIGYIGNFEADFSTENDRKAAFEQLGHKVVTFQENKTNPAKLMMAAGGLDALFYSHTHGWNIPNLKTVFARYKTANIPTVSVHLDRWAGLGRQADMGNEATWFTQYIFMADASPEAAQIYDKMGINWHYLKPAVAKKYCYMAKEDKQRFPHEVIFVGSKNYHVEYPYRSQLIEWLSKTYGNIFGHYGNDGLETVRGDDLNVLYASASVAVGDSCFGGRPNYVSDRYYETRGRAGVLIHPKVEGVDTNGVTFYKHGDFNDLRKKIDRLLNDKIRRQTMRILGHQHVAEHETYTVRAQQIIDTVFGGER